MGHGARAVMAIGGGVVVSSRLVIEVVFPSLSTTTYHPRSYCHRRHFHTKNTYRVHTAMKRKRQLEDSHDWFQSDSWVLVSLFLKGADKADIEKHRGEYFQFREQSVGQ